MKLENNEICRIVDGDEIAFNRFMEHYSSRLYHYTFALLGQKESAEEIVSDVFFEVWKNKTHLIKPNSYCFLGDSPSEENSFEFPAEIFLKNY